MANLADLRRKYPEFFKDKSDADLVGLLAQRTGRAQTVVADDLGLNYKDYIENEGTLADVGTALHVGVQNIPRGLAGLGDMAIAGLTLGNYAPLTPALDKHYYERFGFNDLQDRMRLNMSPESKDFDAQQQKYKDEGDYLSYAGNLLTSPSQWAIGLGGMAPDMVVGGLGGRLAKGAKWAENTLIGKHGYAVGEGGVISGQTMNQALTDGADPGTAANASLAAGTLGGGGWRAGRRPGSYSVTV